MGFFDLSLPYNEPPRSGGKEIASGKTLRLKLATKAMELGYVGIAHNRSIKGVMSDKDYCTIPLLTLGSLIKFAPRLAFSVGFYRDLLGVPRATSFWHYTRLTIHVESNAQCQGLNSRNLILKSYDIVTVRPMNQNAFDYACEKAEVDIISIDFSDKMAFRLKHTMVKAAIQRGIYFEIKYSDLLMDAQTRRQVISNAKLQNLEVLTISLLRLSTERARAAISKNCRNMIAKVLKKKRFQKEAVRVELLSSVDTFNLEKSLSGDCMKWDPLLSGEGDMLLDDLANAFDAASAVANKTSEAIDFTSVLDALPTHGFRVTDIVGIEPLIKQPGDKIIDAPLNCNNQVSELLMADSAASDDNLCANESVSQVNMLIYVDRNKMESTTIVPQRKCSTSQGQGILVQNRPAASLTLIRCTKSNAASDVSMHIEATSEDGTMSPTKSDDEIVQSPFEKLNMETIAVDEDVKEGDIGHVSNEENHTAKPGHHASTDDDGMKIDGSLEANHNKYMEVTMEDQKHETSDSNINLPNLSSETTDLLRKSGKSLSPEAVGRDHDQVSRLESNETELKEEPSVPYHNTFEIKMEEKKVEEITMETRRKEILKPKLITKPMFNPLKETMTQNQVKPKLRRVEFEYRNYGVSSLFLLKSSFKRIGKRGKHRRA